MREKYSTFFKSILSYNIKESYIKIEKSSKKISIENDLVIFEYAIYKACEFWKKNVRLRMFHDEELWDKDDVWDLAVDTFRVFEMVETFERAINKLKSNILNDHRELYLMITKSKEFVKIIEKFRNSISMLRMVPVNDMRQEAVNVFKDGYTQSSKITPWYYKHYQLPDTFLNTLAENWELINGDDYDKIQDEILKKLCHGYCPDDPYETWKDANSDGLSMYHIMLEIKKDKKLTTLLKKEHERIVGVIESFKKNGVPIITIHKDKYGGHRIKFTKSIESQSNFTENCQNQILL